MEAWHFIVGLGNPGTEYARTRHNVGFMLVELLAQRWQTEWASQRKFQARLAKVSFGEGRVLLVQPETYMNSSGIAVRALVDYYQLTRQKLVVVVDDADLPLGEIRLRPGGGAGGHHGLESISAHLGSRDYPRLRIGIGRRDGVRQITDYVLGRLSKVEAEVMRKVLLRAAEQLECWLTHGLQKAMSQFNGVVDDSTNEGKMQ